MKRARVVDMPEDQFLGALERQLDALASEIDAALADSQKGRDLRDRADELIAKLATVRRTLASRSGREGPARKKREEPAADERLPAPRGSDHGIRNR